MNATAGNDTLIGTAGNDSISGLEGNDFIEGLAGNDSLNGDNGEDTLVGGAGDDIINGNGGRDRIFVISDSNIILTDNQVEGDGTDTISNIELATLNGNNEDNSIDASSTTKIETDISGAGGNDTLMGGAKADTIFGNSGNDIINGGKGNDSLNGGSGINRIDGGEGIDSITLNYSTLSGSINHNGYAENYGSTYSQETNQYIHYHENVESVVLTGTDFNDTVSASGFDNTLDGALGRDRLYLGWFNQTDDLNVNVDFTVTNNQVTGINGTQINNFETIGGIATGSGDDTISLTNTEANFAWVDGGDGVDSLSADFSTLGQGINYLSVYNLESISIVGTEFDDTLKGSNPGDTLNGGAGIDFLNLDFSDETDNLNIETDLDSVENQVTLNNTALDISNFERSNIVGGEGEDTITLNYSNLSGSIYLDTFGLENYGNVFSYETNQYIHYHSDVENVSITGTSFNDTLIGNNGRDTLIGSEGNDTLKGNDDNDILNGGSGSDTVIETANTNFTLTDTSLTGNGNDTLTQIESVSVTGGDADNALIARDATQMNVTFDGGLGNDNLVGGSKNDDLIGGEGNDRLAAKAGNDRLTGGMGNDTLYADNGNDSLDGGNDNDILYGQNGNDTMTGSAGDDTLNGGWGSDTIVEVADTDFTLNNTTLTGNGTDTLTQIEAVSLTGGAGDNAFIARDATQMNVTFDGGLGNDNLVGGSKNDDLIGGEGNDRLAAKAGNDRLTGGMGNDTLYADNGNDSLDGGNDNDILYGQNGNDTMTGSAGNDILNGGWGSDTIVEVADTDFTLNNTTLTGNGTDTLTQIEAVSLTGGAGDNAFIARDATQMNVTFDGGLGNDNLVGGSKNDDLIGRENNDRLAGKAGNDRLTGGAGNDTLYGDEGSDRLIGGNDNDILYGQDGNDTLTGGAGDDTFFGNGGNDVFVLEPGGEDVIIDFDQDFDLFGLTISIGFSDLSITDNADRTATLIQDTTDNNRLLAVIDNVMASSITADDFINI